MVIDCNKPPVIPNLGDDWILAAHRGGGMLDLARTTFSLFRSPQQIPGKFVETRVLDGLLEGERPANACVLEHFLGNPESIPPLFAGQAVYFRDSVYSRDGGLYILGLISISQRPAWVYRCITSGEPFGQNEPLVIIR